MWRFKPFMQKEPTGLEGRSIDVGNLKIQVLKAIAEGGFSCVYLARDAVHLSKQYALKHIICNDDESLGLVMKEISVMKSLKGHPNVVTLCTHTVFDMGRTKEAFLVMEFCEKTLVNVLDSRGAGYFDEKQVLSIFRDVCNAVFAMHCQSPPIAHRDLKAENLLLGPDGLWKLCDFGSTSTNHKRFEKPEEMGIEEDNIRKYTTPAYRAPEMWDLFLRELINEKVDIWALGCLLFRICFFKSAFDGESKLQVLNGNYRIPEMPEYNSAITDLIRDMLQLKPDDRPDITQVWFRVNDLLPANLQKSLPDRPPELLPTNSHEGTARSTNKSPPMPQRSPPPPPLSGEPKTTTQPSLASRGGSSGSLGAFWSTQHAKETRVTEDKGRPIFDEEPPSHHISSKHDSIRPDNHPLPKNVGPNKVNNVQTEATNRNTHGKLQNPDDGSSKDFELTFVHKDTDPGTERPIASNMKNTTSFQDQTFNSFVAEFDTNKLNSGSTNDKSEREKALEAEVENLKVQLKQVNMEKAEITSKFEKLSAICRSQRQEIHDLKQAVAARTPSPNKDTARKQTSPGIRSPATVSQQREKIEGTVWERQQGKSDWKTPNSEPKLWQAFPEESKPQQSLSADTASKSVRTRNGRQSKQASPLTSDFDTWGFGTDSFTAVHAGNPQTQKPMSSGNNSQGLPMSSGNSSQGFGETKTLERKSASQPAGWAGF
ncbi:Serine/Threonine kinase family protein [Quillaja saponaria]|uniref:non-specific serine/threonine protein kinase n=1 Tax=Quillaja saponaria TaxID=32244 RepID=A0AAD7QII3_QUISA|nr:Serine/Threonine kinase family protein [Quillaja saponaria]